MIVNTSSPLLKKASIHLQIRKGRGKHMILIDRNIILNYWGQLFRFQAQNLCSRFSIVYMYLTTILPLFLYIFLTPILRRMKFRPSKVATMCKTRPIHLFSNRKNGSNQWTRGSVFQSVCGRGDQQTKTKQKFWKIGGTFNW